MVVLVLAWVMKAIAVLRHALRMLLGNFSAALRVSAVLFVVLQVLKVLERQSLLDGNNAELMEQSVLQVLIGLLASICGIVAMSWIAVAWHRFVLLGERPVLLPRLHLGRMWAYLGRGLQATLLPALAVGVIGLFF